MIGKRLSFFHWRTRSDRSECWGGTNPPTLDDLGLAAALRAAAAQYETSLASPRISVRVPDDLPPLPAAVEVAAYRIVQEALANVIRHAEARTCVVRLSLKAPADVLYLEVMDDGRGVAAAAGGGVGGHSMRERAAELGGSCLIDSPPTGGTHVRAELPCKAPSAS